MTAPGQPGGERGGATLLGLALAGFILMVGLVGVDVGALAVARAAAQTAADLAALAALAPQQGQAVSAAPDPRASGAAPDPRAVGAAPDPRGARAAGIAPVHG